MQAFWVGDISIGQPSGIWLRQRKVHFAETEESFLLLETQPERVFRRLVFCPVPESMCTLARGFASKRLLFCIATCQTLGWIGWGWVLVRLLTQFFLSPSVSHLKDYIFAKADRRLRQREERLRRTQLSSIKVTSTWHRELEESVKGTVRKFQADKGQKEGFALRLNILTVLVARASDTCESQFTI